MSLLTGLGGPGGLFAGRYRIQGELGRGGMAIVYLAEDVRLRRDVAIKVFRPDLAASLGPERFLREIEIAAQLNHPHILPLLDSGDADGLLYYVMPYVEGESLRDRLTRVSQLPLAEALEIARQVAAALGYAHQHHVVHRDIKPENILLSGDQVVVADFGIARAITEAGGEKLTSTGIAVGTPAYMSPEQATAESRLDGRSDIYSLGCVLYEMLAGWPPFAAPSAQAILARRLTDPVPPLRTVRETVPPELEQTVARALAKAPADRFATANEFAAALKGGAEPAGPAGRRRSLRWMIGAAGVAVASLVGLIFAMRSRTTPAFDANLLAVAPFDVLDSRFELYHEGLVDMLSRSLDGAGSLRTVSPTVVLHRWAGRADRASAAALGTRTGARFVVFGQLVGLGGDSVHLKASLLDAVTGRVLGERERADRADRIDPLVDSITVDVLRDMSPGSRGSYRLSSVGTRSLPALKAYLQGERYARQGAFDSAMIAYLRGAALDTAFALDLHGLVQARGWQGLFDSDSLVRRAAASNHGLSPRDSLLIAADSLGLAASDPRNTSRFSDGRRWFATLRAAVQRYPEDPELWYELGDARYHAGWFEGATAQETRAAFDRAIAVDSSYAPAYLHLVTLALATGDATTARRYVHGYFAAGRGVYEGHGMGIVALVLNDTPSAGAALARTLDTASADVLFGAFDAISGWRDSSEVAVRVLRILAHGRHGTSPYVTDTTSMSADLRGELSVRGHLREARALQDGRFGTSFVDLALAGAFSGTTAARIASRWVRAPGDSSASLGSPGCEAVFGLAWWWGERGDRVELKGLPARLPRMLGSGGLPPGVAEIQAISQFSLAALALARRDTAEALHRLLSVPDSACLGEVYVKLAKFQLLAATGRDLDAAREFDRGLVHPLGGATGILATLQRGAVAERLGDRETAGRMYQMVLDAWRHADPELQSYVAEARDGLRRVSGEPRR